MPSSKWRSLSKCELHDRVAEVEPICEPIPHPIATMRPTAGAPRVGCLTFDLDTLPLDLFDGGVLTPVVSARLEEISYEYILPRILKFLDEVSIHSTFFVIGRHAVRYPHWIREIVRRGHEVANHTLNHHKTFSLLTRDEIYAEVRECHKALATIVDAEPGDFGEVCPVRS